MVIVKLAAVRIYLNVVEAHMAEYFCINMAAAIAPKVEFTAIYTERSSAAVTEDDGRNFSATRTGSGRILYYNHKNSRPTDPIKGEKMQGEVISVSCPEIISFLPSPLLRNRQVSQNRVSENTQGSIPESKRLSFHRERRQNDRDP